MLRCKRFKQSFANVLRPKEQTRSFKLISKPNTISFTHITKYLRRTKQRKYFSANKLPELEGVFSFIQGNAAGTCQLTYCASIGGPFEMLALVQLKENT